MVLDGQCSFQQPHHGTRAVNQVNMLMRIMYIMLNSIFIHYFCLSGCRPLSDCILRLYG